MKYILFFFLGWITGWLCNIPKEQPILSTEQKIMEINGYMHDKGVLRTWQKSNCKKDPFAK